VLIPEGRSEAELWEIFKALTEVVDEGETVVFDITHSFRSLPFLTFLAAAYLRTARQVEVHKIIYGAFDAKDDENRSPVFDLTPFVSLLDWITATNQFVYTGDGRYLARLLKANDLFEHPQRRLMPEEREAEAASKRIRHAAQAIEETTAAILTSLIPHAEQASWNLIRRLEQAADDLNAIAPPYRLLAERVRTTYAPFALEKPMMQDIAADLRLQLAMARWYLDKGHIPQAGTLMREWLVSAIGYRLGISAEGLQDNKGPRGEVERVLGWAVQQQMGIAEECSPPWAADLCTWPEFEELIKLWNELANWRNVINHGAMRKNWAEIQIGAVLDKGEEFYAALMELAQAWDLSLRLCPSAPLR
jgi:CRISPR-associated DxTHG motif protein